jgi:hypothetical protein
MAQKRFSRTIAPLIGMSRFFKPPKRFPREAPGHAVEEPLLDVPFGDS